MRALLAAIASLALAAGLAACSEKEQFVVYKQGKYQGKPDTRPWDNPPVAGGKWTQGDRATWENHVKARQFTQHEDRRIYQQ
jgi:hypothetical protein